MATLRLPPLPQGSAAVLRHWLARPGEPIAAGQVVAVVETEAGLVHVEAPHALALGTARVAVGQAIQAGDVLAETTAPTEPATALPVTPEAKTSAAPKSTPAPPADPAPSAAPSAATPILMPEAGNSMEEGTIIAWKVRPGDRVTLGQVLCEIETDKATMEYESPAEGRLARIVVNDGESVAVKQPIAYFAERDQDADAIIAGGSMQSDAPAPVAGDAPSATTTPAAVPDGVTPILMPEAGNSMEEGTIIAWKVKPGDAITPGQILCEIETDKATMEYESPAAGRLSRIVVSDGETIAVKQPIAFLADRDADVDAYLAASSTSPAAPAISTPTPAVATPSAAAPLLAVPSNGRVKASPAARRIAAEKGLDLATVPAGSGPAGRILSTDLGRARPAAAATAPAPSAVAPPQRKPMSKMRRAIATNLQKSKQTVPHFYVRITIDAGPLFAFQKQHKPTTGCTVNDVIVLAVARTMAQFPAVRTRLENDELAEYPHANIGIAVGVTDGLVVPVVPNADQMSLAQLAAAANQTVEFARKGRVDNMGKGNFTVSNLGMFGVEEFAAIINPPESAILAVSAARESVIVKDGGMRPGRVMTMTLSVDHRVVDGLLAAQFVAALKTMLENPAELPVS